MPRRSRASFEIVHPTPPEPPRPSFDPPPPPPDLGAPECVIWRHVFEDYRHSARLSADVLHSGLLSYKLARESQAAVDATGLTVLGRDGQLRAHPLLSVIRDARAAWLQAIKLLGLEL